MRKIGLLYTTVAFLAISCMTTSKGFCSIDQLLRTIPSPTPATATGWGGVLEPASGNTALVGSGGPGNYFNSDAPVRLVDISTGEIIQSFIEPPAYPQANDHFGSSLSYVGDYVLVGAFATDLAQPTGEDAGVVHVYGASTGDYLRTIQNPNPTGSGSFGLSLAVVGDYVAVGTYKDVSSQGAAYLVDPATGGILTQFENPSGNRYDNFGSTVGAIGDDVLVGARNRGTVYRFDALTGQLKQTYVHPAGGGGYFGTDIVATNDKVIISAPTDWLVVPYGGAAYSYDAETGVLLNTFVSPTTPTGAEGYGISMTLLDESTLVIGESADASTGAKNGAVSVYDIDSGEVLTHIPHPAPPIPDQEQRFGGAVARVGGSLVVGSQHGNNISIDGPVFVYQGLIPEPSSATLLIVGGLAMLRRR